MLPQSFKAIILFFLFIWLIKLEHVGNKAHVINLDAEV